MAVFKDDLLTIEVVEEGEQVIVRWSGRSTSLRPADFVMPIMLNAMGQAAAAGKRLVLDFFQLDHVNSSTITPIVKILETARRGQDRVTLVYNQSLNWQDVSFTALQVFTTRDGRVAIEGLQ